MLCAQRYRASGSAVGFAADGAVFRFSSYRKFRSEAATAAEQLQQIPRSPSEPHPCAISVEEAAAVDVTACSCPDIHTLQAPAIHLCAT